MSDIILMILGPVLLIHLFFIFAVMKKDLSVIDTAWGLGFIVISLIGSLINRGSNLREVLVTLLIALWGIRLAVFIRLRNHGKGEDFRYANMRKKWGDKTNFIAYFKVYWLQIVLMLVVALPLFSVHGTENYTLRWFNYLGVFLWLVGLTWESVADYQKSQFKNKKENHDKIMQEGLWKLSRHPNYFGESLLWWGIALVAMDTSHSFGLLGAAFITLLLWKVTGVPLVEQRHDKNPQYQAYKAQTPVLIPSLKRLFN
jgi:steroid 5-alpha reductase family enzyme